jgi:hypothetical protein
MPVAGQVGSHGRGKREKPCVFSMRHFRLLVLLFVALYVRLLWSASVDIHGNATPVTEDDKHLHASKSSFDTARGKPLNETLVKPLLGEAKQLAEKNSPPQANNEKPITIAFASTVTGCGKDPFTEGAAVLKHSIHLSSVHGNKGGRYDYKMYIIYHPDAAECTLPLADLGFELLRRDTPVKVSDIQGDLLRERIQTNGCCGEKELIKLEAYTLIQHPIVVLLDLDVLVFKPMDTVFDLMLDTSENPDTSQVPLMWPEKPLPRPVDVFWTKDYNVVAAGRRDKPTQGGLLILRPNLDVYREFVQIVHEGDYRSGHTSGWGGIVGPFYGGMTIQGLIPWYYEFLHKDDGGGVELNRCAYNNMADNPREGKTVKNVAHGKCKTNTPDCEDCRSRAVEDIFTFHFTICQKPWKCLPHKQDILQMRICRKTTAEWFRYRSELEKSWGRSGNGTGSFETEIFLGYCKFQSFKGYQPIRLPYGQP